MVDRYVRNCVACAQSDKSAKPCFAPILPVELPDRPWRKLAIDFIGPFSTLPAREAYAVVLMDYFSKWPEVEFVSKISTEVVIEFLENVFAREGVPETLVSDKGVQFTSTKMAAFLKRNGIQHVRVALYNPSSNGLIERFNRVVKETIQLALKSGIPWKEAVRKMLSSYRESPHSVKGKMPFELLRGRKPSTGLVPLWLMERNREKFKVVCDEEMKNRVLQSQAKFNHNVRSSTGGLKVGQSVRVKLPGFVEKGKSQWSEPKKIVRVLRNAVKLDDGKVWNVRRVSICRGEPNVVIQDARCREECSGYLFGSDPTGMGESGCLSNYDNECEVPRRSERNKTMPTYLKDYVIHK
ncbi:hypothetical protein NDU88_003688 [Pleurodeles waltl]|uniref:Integrase catalytic domain-containing protein n=1 Tax=Pleurodeles waltl TaxID=8319 RepID=A0AAV7QDT0_PLEWA|nr:hypothetical protein NDU88_003688 [Pleurodeles waltl]